MMKKVFLIILLLMTVACQKEEEKEISNVEEPKKELVEPVKEEYVDTNPIKVGLYNKGKLINEMNFKFKDKTDITALEVVFTDISDLKSTNLKENFNKYYQMYDNIKDYKIGFYIELEANGEKLENLLLNPDNMHKLHPYLYLYLYDGVHAKGRYTHLTMDDLKDDTIYSTIKLFLFQKSNEITSPIKLTVFTYKDENDFLDGHYRGNSKHTVTIYNK